MKIASVTSITSTDVILYIFFMHKDTHTAVASVITALPYSQHPLHNGPLQDSSPAAVYDKMQTSRRSKALACARRRHDVTRCNGMISTRPQRCKDYVTYETGSTVDNNLQRRQSYEQQKQTHRHTCSSKRYESSKIITGHIKFICRVSQRKWATDS